MEENSTLPVGSSSTTTTTTVKSVLLSNLTNVTTEAVNFTVARVTESFKPESASTERAVAQNISQKVSVQPTLRVSETTTSPSTTAEPYDEFGPPEGIEYIFVPLGVMIFVILLSAVVFIISRKRKLERLRHRLMPLYNFDPSEEGEDDWETELLDEGFNGGQRRQAYQSMDRPVNVELFSGL